MRVALIDPGGYTHPYDHSLARALAALGHGVHLFTSPFRFGELPDPDGFRREEIFFRASHRVFRQAPRSPLRIPAKGIEYVPDVVRLVRRLHALRPDLVHVQWTVVPRFDRRWIRSLAATFPTVFTAHDVSRRQKLTAAWRDVASVVDAVVVHSHAAAAALRTLGLDEARIVYVTHPVFEAQEAQTKAARGQTLLFFGLLRKYKGLDLLVRAFELVLREVPEATLVVAGDAYDSIARIRRLARKTAVDQRIEWRVGYLADEDIADVVRAASVAVLPYREGDASGVLATALGHGLPAVVSDVGSLGEIVSQFGAGAVVPPGDVAARAGACIRLLTDARARASARGGAMEAARVLTWERAARAHERAYADVVARRRRAC